MMPSDLKQRLQAILTFDSMRIPQEGFAQIEISTPHQKDFWLSKKRAQKQAEREKQLSYRLYALATSHLCFSSSRKKPPTSPKGALTLSMAPFAQDKQANHNHHLCSICYDDTADGLFGETDAGCGHGFCVDCLLSWSQRSNQCPLCRGVFIQVKDVRVGVIRAVIPTAEMRAFVNEEFPHLRTSELHLEYCNRSLVFL